MLIYFLVDNLDSLMQGILEGKGERERKLSKPVVQEVR